jgi:prepilin-type N-terminal cleavage/methylation domain-containing protein
MKTEHAGFRIPNLKSEITNRKSVFRRAFTLIELLVVIVIIGILMGLMVAAAGPVRILVLNWRMKSEVTQMALALERVRSDLGGGQYPPDSSNLAAGSVSTADFQQFFRRAFSRCQCTFALNSTPPTVTVSTPTGTLTYNLPGNPAEALVFWLGGARDTSGNFIGFSSNPLNPFDTSSSTGRIGPFFEFDRSRVGPGASSNGNSNFSSNPWNWVYYPQNNLTTNQAGTPITAVAPPSAQYPPQPYTYFKAVANAYAPAWTSGYNCNCAMPFVDAAATVQAQSASSNAPPVWVNAQSFQLLCPGLDGLYGDAANTNGPQATTQAPNPPLYPSGTWSGGTVNLNGSNYGKNTLDDITNFSKGSKLESDMP